MTGLWPLLVWFLLWGIPGALIAPRKGLPTWGGFLVSGLFALFGLAGLVLLADARDLPPPAPRSLPDTAPTRVKVYRPGEESWFRHDQADAAAHGWHPVSRDFTPDGSLRVTYRRQGASEWA